MKVLPRPALPARRRGVPGVAGAIAFVLAAALPARAADEAGTPPEWSAPLRTALAAAVALPDAQARIEIEPGRLDPRLRLAPCRRIEPVLPAQGSLWGRTRVGLRCVEGERHWQVWLPVTIKVFAPALVAARALPAGTVIAAEHLERAEVDWAADAAGAFARADALLGRTLARPLAAGQALRGTDLRQRQWFATGEQVLLQARGPGFEVEGEGQALGPGIDGQPVRVRTESGRVVSGMPVGERRVQVSL